MDPIAMVAQAAQPATEVKQVSAGQQNGAGGVFETLMSRALGIVSEADPGAKKKMAEAGDPMMWLLSALLQQTQAPVGGQPAATQAEGALQTVDAIRPAGQPAEETSGVQDSITGTAMALLQWVSANPEQFESMVSGLHSGEVGGAQLADMLGAAVMSGEPQINGFDGWQQADFVALLQSAIEGQGQQAAANPADSGDVNGALNQIKELFAQALTASGEGAQGVVQGTGIRGQQRPADGAPQAPVAAVNAAAAPVSERAAPAAAKADDNPASAGSDARGKAAADTDTVALHAAMKAYHTTVPAAAGASAPAQPEAVTAATRPGTEAFDAIVQSIRSLQNSSAGEMQIELKPEFLGKVTISLSMEEGGMVAKIAAANPRVQDSFLSQAQSLQSALADQGLKDVRVVVTSSSVQDLNLQQQADRRSQNQQQQQKRHRFITQGAAAPVAPALQAYEALYSTGTINYLA